LPGTTDNPGLPAGTSADQDALVDGVKGLLTSSTWEHKIGGLMAAKVRRIAQQRFTTRQSIHLHGKCIAQLAVSMKPRAC
jgi:hypothetical protein